MSRVIRYLLAGCIAVMLLVGAFSGGILVGWVLPNHKLAAIQANPLNSESATTQTGPTNNALFAPFWEAWNIVHDQFVDQPVNDTDLMRGAIRGMMQALGDQHSSYMDPEEYKQANMPMDGQYEGIGAWVDTTGEYLTITSPMKDSPAEKAGLQPGDKIIKVDGEDMTSVDGSLVLQRILGPSGTQVTLTILRESQPKPFDVTIKRAKISVASVESKMLDNDIAYVKLTTFGEKTTDELATTLKDLMKQKPKGLILDLRNNGGGYLNTAIEVVSQFIPQGVVMHEEYGDGSQTDYKALPNGLATEIPLVVLVNEGTASASEITAGAIQDLGRGELVGVTTYGKGSVQNWIPLQNSQGAVRVTIARWLTPNGRQIHEVGLQPDVEVQMTEEDMKAGLDPQLDKAVEVLTSGAAN